MEEPDDGACVTVRTSLGRTARPDLWIRDDSHASTRDAKRWHNQTRRRAPKTWRELRRHGTVRLVDPPVVAGDGRYPTCSTCGHRTSAVLAGQCTVFVPVDGPRLAVMCGCRCVDDPVVKAWLEG